MRGGDRVTVLTPHAEGLPPQWQDDGVEVVTFRYAPVEVPTEHRPTRRQMAQRKFAEYLDTVAVNA